MSDVPQYKAGDVVRLLYSASFARAHWASAGELGIVSSTDPRGDAVFVRLGGRDYSLVFTQSNLEPVSKREAALFHARLALGIEP